MAVSLNDYLKNNKTVQAAQKKVSAAQSALVQIQKAQAGTPANAGAATLSSVNSRVNAAEKALTQAKKDFDNTKQKATEYYNANVDVIQKRQESRTAQTDKDRLSDAYAMRQRLIDNNQPTTAVDASIKDLNDKINKRGKYAPNAQTPKTGDAPVTDEVAADLNKEYEQDLLESGRYIAGLDDAGRSQLATSLNNVYGSKLPTNGKYSKELKDTYVRALTDNYTRSLDFNQKISLPEFLVIAQNEGTYKGGGTGGAPAVDDYVTISSPSVAKGIINQVFQNELQRDATAEELKKFIPGLIAAQKKNPNRVKVVKGVRQTVQGLDAGQWITDRLQKLPEYAQRKEDKTIPSIQVLQETARNNGLTLLPSQIESYKLRLQNGEKLETIQANIRATVANTMPDSVKKLMDSGNDLSEIYQPYRQSMAAILEIPFDKIDLSDPTLTNAITDKGNMTIFDFKRSLRKDARWQYTDNAREEVSNVALGVLRDFGFQG
jgi:hypothetical protein